MTNIRLAGVEHALQFTAVQGEQDKQPVILVRSYKILMRKSSDAPRTPRAELEEIGPSLDLVLRRSHLASDDLYKTACKQVRENDFFF